MKINQKGFGAVEVIIVLVVVGLIGGAGWYVWQKNKDNDSTKTTQNDRPSKSENKPAEQSQQTSASNFLVLTDFNAKIPLDDKTSGLKLGAVKQSAYSEADKSVPIIASQLDSVWKCEVDADGNFKGTIGTISITTGVKRAGPQEPLATKKVGNYTFGFEQGGANCTDSPEYQKLVDAFKVQFEKIEAN